MHVFITSVRFDLRAPLLHGLNDYFSLAENSHFDHRQNENWPYSGPNASYSVENSTIFWLVCTLFAAVIKGFCQWNLSKVDGRIIILHENVIYSHSVANMNDVLTLSTLYNREYIVCRPIELFDWPKSAVDFHLKKCGAWSIHWSTSELILTSV